MRLTRETAPGRSPEMITEALARHREEAEQPAHGPSTTGSQDTAAPKRILAFLPLSRWIEKVQSGGESQNA